MGDLHNRQKKGNAGSIFRLFYDLYCSSNFPVIFRGVCISIFKEIAVCRLFFKNRHVP